MSTLYNKIMENKNSRVQIIVAGIAGILIGWLIWGMSSQGVSREDMTHMMPDGTVMGNDSSDMSSMMMDMNAALTGKTGDAFDQAFLSEMIVHHQGAIDMAELALTNARHQEIKDLAKAIVAAQTKEIDQMEKWESAWYK